MPQPFVTSMMRAFRGLVLGFQTEVNIRRECVAGLGVLALILILPLSTAEILAVLFVTALVFVVEFVNTAFERLLNLIKPQFHEEVRDIKDLCAGAVLITALVAAVVGLLVFGPYASFLIRHV